MARLAMALTSTLYPIIAIDRVRITEEIIPVNNCNNYCNHGSKTGVRKNPGWSKVVWADETLGDRPPISHQCGFLIERTGLSQKLLQFIPFNHLHLQEAQRRPF